MSYQGQHALAAVAHAASIDQIRLTASEIAAHESGGAGAGTSGVAGIETTVLLGDPTKTGLYTIRLSIPANTRIQAHTHAIIAPPLSCREFGTSAMAES
jgi:hypothetical protein